MTHDPKKANPPTNMEKGTCDCVLKRQWDNQCYFPLYIGGLHGHCTEEKGHE